MSESEAVSAETSPRHLVIKCTWSRDAPERAHQALNVAAVAVASGVKVTLWFASDGTWLALPHVAEDIVLAHGAPLAELRDAVLAGGEMVVCSPCLARRNIEPSELIPGINVGGAAQFVEQITAPGAQALVY